MAETRKRVDGLWRHSGFLLLWSGQSVSQIGSQVTLWALPLVAILLLKVTPFQMGILALMGRLPLLLIGIVAGAWVDRLSYRRILITTDIGRALLIGSIPVAALLGMLSLAQLYVIAFLVGVLTVFFDVAYQSFLPSLVEHDQLVSANSKLEASTALASIIGPGLAGTLVQLISGPLAMIVDAVSFVVSAASLAGIHAQEITASNQTASRKLRAEIGEGLHFVWKQPIIRALVISAALFNLFDTMMGAEYVLYLTRTLGIGALFVGIVGALGGVGWLLGALVTMPLTRRFGLGTTLIVSILLACLAKACIAVAGGPFLFALGLVMFGEFLFQGIATVFIINSTSLRQIYVPAELRGRVTAVVRVVSWGIGSFGALLGGALAEWSNLRTTMIIAALGTVLALIWIVFSPVRTIKSL
jgi:MFS family permease